MFMVYAFRHQNANPYFLRFYFPIEKEEDIVSYF